MSQKYELIATDKTTLSGAPLLQIRALRKFSEVGIGDLGGYVQSEANLSQGSDNAWISGDAQVYGNAQVCGDAQVFGNARVYGDAQVFGDAWVFGNARVYGDAQVFGNAWVSGNARVSGNAQSTATHHVLSVTGLRWPMTSTTAGVQVGCHNHSMQVWKADYARIGAENGLSPELAKEYFRLMKALRRIQRLEERAIKAAGEGEK